MSERIAAAALAWESARREVLRLKAERDACICPAERTFHSLNGEPEPVGFMEVLPCWRSTSQDDDGDIHVNDDQCETCRRRYEIHKAMKSAGQARGAKLRGLRAMLGHALKSAAPSPDGGTGA